MYPFAAKVPLMSLVTSTLFGFNFVIHFTPIMSCTMCTSYAQICINIHPDAVPPIHAESYHVATDKGPLQVPVYF